MYCLYGVFEGVVPIRKQLPFWVVGLLMCVVVYNHPDWATLSPLGRKLN